MILKLLKKQKISNSKRKMVKIIIESLNIPNNQKELFLSSLEVLNNSWFESLYKDLIWFVENIEIKELEKIKNTDFSIIAWMTNKEAEEKKKEMNSFSFLLHNL